MAATAVGRADRDRLFAKFYERLGQEAAATGDFKTAVHYRELAISFLRRACTIVEHSLHELRVAHSRRGELVAAGPRLQAGARPRGAGRPRAQATRSSAKSGDSGSDSDPPPWRSDRCPSCLEWRMWRGGDLVCVNGACEEYGL